MLSCTIPKVFTWSILLLCCLSQNLNFKDGKFKILQMTDLHYGESEERDNNNVKIQEALIERVKPDVVMATGDIVSGYAYHGQPNFQQDIWKKFTAPFYKNKVPYAFVQGNHDVIEGGLKKEVIFELERQSEYSLLRHYLDSGFPTFTYYLPVYSSLKKDEISSLLWILNSNTVGCHKDRYSWGCIEDKDVAWYSKKSKMIDAQHGKNIHHLAFFHIAIPEYLNLVNEAYFYGIRGEGTGCPTSNTGAFNAFKEGNVQATFVGHDHNNDYGGWYDGIELIYGRKTGYGGYGPDFSGRGGRVIELTESLQEDGSIKIDRSHYVVLENGEIDEERTWNDNVISEASSKRQKACPSLNSMILNPRFVTFMFILLYLFI